MGDSVQATKKAEVPPAGACQHEGRKHCVMVLIMAVRMAIGRRHSNGTDRHDRKQPWMNGLLYGVKREFAHWKNPSWINNRRIINAFLRFFQGYRLFHVWKSFWRQVNSRRTCLWRIRLHVGVLTKIETEQGRNGWKIRCSTKQAPLRNDSGSWDTARLRIATNLPAKETY